MIFKCKMCGGALNITVNTKVCTCEYCGTIQTIPNLDDEKINRLIERGNELIRNCQFDDAIGKFEEALSLRNNDPEIYWSLLMAKFGVTYEKDPYTGNMIPTIHRNQDISIFLDEDYKLTLQYADSNQKEYYEKTAKIIDNIQKKYNAISEKEDPFDVFICYKQTDDTTKQDTEDYKIAYELYNALTNEGYRVFFSHITLEDKIGEEYEPYIYAALKSSKVLLAIGTKQEYYNAVWVKNEWSRFMFMMRNDHSKRIIPICANTSILPKEFNRYQAIQTNNNIVWKEDLIRTINKIFSLQKSSKEKNNVFSDLKKINKNISNNIINNANKNKRIDIKKAIIVAVIFVIISIIASYVIREIEFLNYSNIYNTTDEILDSSDSTSSIDFRKEYSCYAIGGEIGGDGYFATIDVISDKEVVLIVSDELMSDLLEKSYGETSTNGVLVYGSEIGLYTNDDRWEMSFAVFEFGELTQHSKDLGVDMIKIDGGYAIYIGEQVFSESNIVLESNDEYQIHFTYRLPYEDRLEAFIMYTEWFVV